MSASMNIDRTCKRASALVRRIPDEQGVLVTYLRIPEASRIVDTSETTVYRWIQVGAVRCTERLAHRRNVALVDLVRLKLMDPKESRAAGIKRVSPCELLRQKAWHEATYARTLSRAEHHRERWDDYDIEFLVSSISEGRSIEIIAKALGRTYDAVCDQLMAMKKQGELPRHDHSKNWLEVASSLLTAEEVSSLQHLSPPEKS